MKKLLLILFFAIAANAEFQNSSWVSTRDNGADLQRTANSLHNIENLLKEQNRLLQQLVNKLDPPKPAPTPKESKQITDDYMDALKQQNPELYNRKLVFPEAKQELSTDQTECIKECARIYETNDKYELKDCLLEMCEFEIEDLID